MKIVTAREFRANQKMYFDLAEHELVLVPRQEGSYVVLGVVKETDFVLGKHSQVFHSSISAARKVKTQLKRTASQQIKSAVIKQAKAEKQASKVKQQEGRVES